MSSKVYYVPVAEKNQDKRMEALEKLLKELAPQLPYGEGEIVPIKLTIGDSTCVYHMSPELVKEVVRVIKTKQVKPFLFDTNVIYHGQRNNAVDHLSLVHSKGFHHSNVGAPFVIGDGLLGQDGKEYEIDAPHIKKIRVPSFIGMLESLLVLSHATGHIFTGYAGAIKNVAMGMSCRATKQVQHSSMKPSIIHDKCMSCGCCVKVCPVGAITFNEKGKAFVDTKKCVGCGECLCACKFDAVYVNWDEEMDIFCSRMDEVAQFILSKFKNKFFINFVFDVTQECD